MKEVLDHLVGDLKIVVSILESSSACPESGRSMYDIMRVLFFPTCQ